MNNSGLYRKYFDIVRIFIKESFLYHFLSKNKRSYPLVTEKQLLYKCLRLNY